MASANPPSRPARESAPLLTQTASATPNPLVRRPTWIQRSSYVIYHAARTTALRLEIRVFWVFVPLGLAAGAFNANSIVVSIFNFLAIIPLSARVSDLSDKLSEEFGDLLGALINATFGNAVELGVRPPQPREFPSS
jgi:Ca2+:H+ antiporter